MRQGGFFLKGVGGGVFHTKKPKNLGPFPP